MFQYRHIMDITTLTSFLPVQITLSGMIKFIAILIIGSTVINLVFRIFFGRRSSLNQAFCATLGILCIYVVTIVVYTFSPGNLEQFLVPLPFVKFSGQSMYLMNLQNSDFPVICSQILSMVILVLLYNLTDSLLPNSEDASPVSWFVVRFLNIIGAMVIHYFLSAITESFLPALLVSYGPTILLFCLVISLLVGVIGTLLGLLLTIANPIIGLLFSFFFSSKLGKQLSKALLSSAILTALVALLSHFGYSFISINATSLLSYIPLLAVMLALWYVINRKL